MYREGLVPWVPKEKGRVGAALHSWQGSGSVRGVVGFALGYLIHAAQPCDGPWGPAAIESFQLFTGDLLDVTRYTWVICCSPSRPHLSAVSQ